MFVDVHSHFLRASHWGDEFEKHWQPVYGYPWPTITPEDYDAAMEGVDAAILFGLTADKAGVFTPDDAIVEFCRATKTPTVGFTAADASMPDSVDRLQGSYELGLRGVKLYPVLSGYGAVDGMTDQVERFLAKATELRMPVLWHMGASPSPAARLRDSLPLFVDDVAIRFPELKQVIAHMGHPWQKDAIAVTRKNRNVYMDVSAQWSRTMEGYLALVHAQEWGVVDRLLFGSDFPLWTPAQAMEALERIADIAPGGLPRVEASTIEHLRTVDALALLGLEDAYLG
jgi:predicted TIM-barrel fold metal-dependent hydrolase